MKITVVGAGPSGLYFALLMKRMDSSHDVTVLERNPPDATYGWGVVFSEDTLTELRDADYPTFLKFDEALVRWSAIDVRYRDRTLRSYGHGFSAISRAKLLAILQQRARDLGVDLRFGVEVDDVAALDTDLVVGADGVRSVVRAAHEKQFGTTWEELGSRYVWFGTDLVFDVFTFIFRLTEYGLFQVHGYPFDGQRSTFIVETTVQTWRDAGLDTMSEEESLAFCADLFADHLGPHRLLSNASIWRTFDTIRNRSWSHGNTVIMGDAAHTAHFSIGSGTKLAIEDAVALSKAFAAHPGNLPAAFAEYELERQGAVERFQEAATDSAHYFEQVSRYLDFEPEQFEFNLLTRSGRITYANLELRDPAVVSRIDRTVAGAPDRIVTPPAGMAPLGLGAMTAANRVVLSPVLPEAADDGAVAGAVRDTVVAAARAGAGMVMIGPVAVSAHARVTSGSPGIWTTSQTDAWRGVLEGVRSEGAVAAVRLTHAGRRGSTRPRERGLDRPLLKDAWTTLAPSPIAYAPWMPPPAAADEQRLRDVRDDFTTAARNAVEAGADAVVVDCSDGYLLASFLSPLSNHRTDEYGGTPENRLRYPLEVIEAVRAAVPVDRPLGVRLLADDRHRGGLVPDEAVDIARRMVAAGVSFFDVTAGQTMGTDAGAGEYRRLYQVHLADRIRNEAGVVAIAGGRITALDEINTVVAAGRADLCVLDPRVYR